MADPFITTADLGDYIGIDVTADGGALIAIDAACDICRDVADQTFNLGTATVTLDGTGTDMLLLPRLPVVNAGTVNVGGTAITDYVVDTDRGALVRKLPDEGADYWTTVLPQNVVWPAGRQNVQVTYEHGYPDAELPRSVRMVALTIASRLVIQGVAQYETVGDVQMRYGVNSTDLTDGERRILYKYRDGRRPD